MAILAKIFPGENFRLLNSEIFHGGELLAFSVVLISVTCSTLKL